MEAGWLRGCVVGGGGLRYTRDVLKRVAFCGSYLSLLARGGCPTGCMLYGFIQLGTYTAVRGNLEASSIPGVLFLCSLPLAAGWLEAERVQYVPTTMHVCVSGARHFLDDCTYRKKK